MRRSNEKNTLQSKQVSSNLPYVEELSAHAILSIFESVLGLYLILKPDAPKFTIVAVSDAYAKATMTKREEILGKGLFEVFLDNPNDPHATGVKNLTASLMSVLKNKKPHKMQLQKYHIRTAKITKFEERYWNSLNKPVLDESGNVSYIVHWVVDVTRAIVAEETERIAEADEAQKRLAAVVESSDDAIISNSIDGTITSWNKGAERLYRYTPEEIIGKPVSVLMPPEKKNDFPYIMKQLHEGKRVEHYETKRMTKDGRILYVSITVSPIRDSQGNIIGVSKVARDISERKKTEKRQKFLEEISNKLVASLNDNVILQDIGKLIISYLADYCRIALIGENKQVKEISVSHTDPTQVSLAEELYENYKDRSEYTHGIPQILKTGKAEIIEEIDKKVLDSIVNNPKLLKVIKQIGLKSYMGVPLIAREKVIGAITFSSISEHRYYSKQDLRFAEELAHRIALALDNVRLYHEAQVELKERKQAELNLKYLAEASKTLSSSLDLKMTLQNIAKLAVPEIADWCGIDLFTDNGLEQVVVVHKDPKKVKWAKELRDKYPPDMNSPTGIAKVIRMGKAEYYPFISHEVLVKIARDKKHLKLLEQVGFTSAMIVPLYRQRKCIGAITFVSAEAKRQYRESDLNMAQELAARASLALDNALLYKASQDAVSLRNDFISVASHELKTPVTSVKIFTEVLQKHSEQIGDQKATEHLSKMNKQLDKLTELIYNMLNISKIQAGRLEFSQKFFNVDATVKEIVDVLQEGATKHKLIIDGKTNKKVYGDEDRIGQVVSNLVSNAVKYSPKASKVIIHLSSSDDEVIICVEDFGIGLAKEHGERIFERFYRVFDTTDKTFPGLGIGLYISSEIIKRHHGRVWVESDTGKGSKFYFSLPLNRVKRANGIKAL